MAYYYGKRSGTNRSYGKNRLFSRRRKNRYTKAEKLAFELGQKERVKDSINSGKIDTRVYEAFSKGYQGIPAGGRKKPLFGN